MPTTTTRALTERQKAFAREYLVDLDGAKAARRAGYSPRSSKQVAFDLLADPRIKVMVQAEMAARTGRVEDSADAVLREIIATGRKALEAGKFDAAIRALELRGRHQGMFKDNLVVSGSLVQELTALNARAQ